MRLPRPYIPLSVRVAVLERMFKERNGYPVGKVSWTLRQKVDRDLYVLFGFDKTHLDHDPPLAARKKIRDKNGAVIGYSPTANDPDYLVYRAKEDHRVKTYVRGEHGQYSDTVLIKRDRKREKKAGKFRKYRWPKRKLKSRSFHAAITTGHGE